MNLWAYLDGILKSSPFGVMMKEGICSLGSKLRNLCLLPGLWVMMVDGMCSPDKMLRNLLFGA